MTEIHHTHTVFTFGSLYQRLDEVIRRLYRPLRRRYGNYEAINLVEIMRVTKYNNNKVRVMGTGFL